MKEQLLPYAEARQEEIDMLVFHCSAYDPPAQIHWMHEYKISAHYLISEEGEIFRLVPEELSAFHAGKGFWRGKESSINQRSIGIELVNKSLGQTPYAPTQVKTLIEISKEIIKRYKISPPHIVGHSDVAPQRKADPGIAFPWALLSAEGIGLWPEENQPAMTETDIASLLEIIGYDTRTPEAVAASAYAFCRRFYPQLVHIDPDVMHLVDNVLPKNRYYLNAPDFTFRLQQVAHVYL